MSHNRLSQLERRIVRAASGVEGAMKGLLDQVQRRTVRGAVAPKYLAPVLKELDRIPVIPAGSPDLMAKPEVELPTLRVLKPTLTERHKKAYERPMRVPPRDNPLEWPLWNGGRGNRS